MILGAFGDSFIFGSDLSDVDPYHLYSSNLTWTALLAKRLNLEYYCLAVPAAGNQQICDDVADMVAKHGNSLIYSIHWTWIDRFDYIAPRLDRFYPTPNWNTVCPATDKTADNMYYKYLHSELLDKIRSLGFIYQTICLLKEHQCCFHMTFMDDLIFDKTYNSTHSVELLQDKVRPHLSNYNGVNFLQWSKDQNFAISDYWHPMEQAHLAASELWLPVYKQLLE
jgi:hypothetical protein